MSLTLAFGSPPATDGVLYVSGSGNDSNDGLGRGSPLRSLSAAYAALPATGGVVFAAPGRYDVGAGLALTRGKPLQLRGLVAPPREIPSTNTAPLSNNCAIVYTSTGAASMITTVGGTAGTVDRGHESHNMLYEFSNAATKVGWDLNTSTHFRASDNYGFADKTSGSPGPAAADAVLFSIYSTTGLGTVDSSWSRGWLNNVMNMALVQLGNATGTKLSCNQHIWRENVGEGLSHSNTTALPLIAIYNGHRCVIRDNNAEGYKRFLLMDSCWDCREDGNGGEITEVWIDLVNCKGIHSDTLGISWAPLGSSTPYLAGATTYRGDTSLKASRLSFPSWTPANTQRMKPPGDDASNPQLTTVPSDNKVITSRYSSDFMDVGGTFTSTPGAVTSLTIPHGLGVAPTRFSAQAGNAAAGTAVSTRGLSVTADATNLTLTFTSALPAATSLAWNWTAQADA